MTRRAALVILAVAAAAVLFIYWRHVAAWSQDAFGFRNGDGNSPQYLFWSGAGSDLAYLSFLAGGIALYRRHNCAKAWCPRIGKHELVNPETGVKRLLCWKHHPDVHSRTLTQSRIQEIQHKRHLYLGEKPGRG